MVCLINKQLYLQIKAIDKDSGINSQIKFSLNGPGTKYLRINPNNGLVTTRTYTSYDVRTTNDVTIIAEDQGKDLYAMCFFNNMRTKRVQRDARRFMKHEQNSRKNIETRKYVTAIEIDDKNQGS